ncbi:MAG: CaiB/BaiF CoA transferase family protein [Candidatus Puniceispirillaceae bacterium]
MPSYTAPMPTGPLTGIRVIELGQIAAGPFAGSLFADLGADVVKIERPDGGDGMRQWPPLTGETDSTPGFSENFASVNRNKRSVALDLKHADDVAQLKQLVAVADIVIENYRPGVLPKLGLGYDDLRMVNKKLIYCSISGYGQTGPYATKGAFDVTVQGIAGIMSVTGEAGAAPVKCGVPIGDFCAGLYAAYSILAVLRQAEATGEGSHIDCSMLGSLLGVSALQTSEYFGNDKAPIKMGSAHPRNAPYQAFEAADSYFVIAAGNDKLWQEVASAVGMAELADDPRFITQAKRAQNQQELVALLAPRFKLRPAAEWLAEMDRRQVPCAPINDFADILHDPHVAHMGLVKPIGLPNGAVTKTVGFPVSISGFQQEDIQPPPALGADNQAVFDDWLRPEQTQPDHAR